jgi:hypothetical protein
MAQPCPKDICGSHLTISTNPVIAADRPEVNSARTSGQEGSSASQKVVGAGFKPALFYIKIINKSS